MPIVIAGTLSWVMGTVTEKLSVLAVQSEEKFMPSQHPLPLSLHFLPLFLSYLWIMTGNQASGQAVLSLFSLVGGQLIHGDRYPNWRQMQKVLFSQAKT